MSMIESPASTEQRARWRCDVGLDRPAPAANPRRIRYDGGAQLSWQASTAVDRPKN